MSIQFLKNDISEKSFRKIYLITGNESYLKNYYLTALKNSMMTKEEEAFDFVKTEGKNLSTEEFFDYTSSFPLSAEKTHRHSRFTSFFSYNSPSYRNAGYPF